MSYHHYITKLFACSNELAFFFFLSQEEWFFRHGDEGYFYPCPGSGAVGRTNSFVREMSPDRRSVCTRDVQKAYKGGLLSKIKLIPPTSKETSFFIEWAPPSQKVQNHAFFYYPLPLKTMTLHLRQKAS